MHKFMKPHGPIKAHTLPDDSHVETHSEPMEWTTQFFHRTAFQKLVEHNSGSPE